LHLSRRSPFSGRAHALPAAALAQPFKPAAEGQDEHGDHADADEQIDENDNRAAVDGYVLTGILGFSNFDLRFGAAS
jgi:hypothetical protein